MQAFWKAFLWCSALFCIILSKAISSNLLYPRLDAKPQNFKAWRQTSLITSLLGQSSLYCPSSVPVRYDANVLWYLFMWSEWSVADMLILQYVDNVYRDLTAGYIRAS